MLDCPVGTYRDTERAESVEDCAPCDAGSYCLTKSTAVSGQCEPGYYCPSPFANVYGNGTGPALIGSYGSRQVNGGRSRKEEGEIDEREE